MKKYIYFRCSTDSQDFQQQKNCVCQHLAKIGLDMAAIDSIITEKVSGTIKHTDRKLAHLIEACEAGDVIYISELSRLGRNMSDLFAIVTNLCNKGKEEAEAIGKKTGQVPPYGVTVIQCKDGTQIENNSVGGKAVLFALSLAAEIEVNNIRQRTQMGLDARREQLRKHGSWISKSGRECTHFGREKGCDMRPAVLAAAQKRQDDLIMWKEQHKGYKWVIEKYLAGMSRKDIIEKFNDYHIMGTEGFSTRSGGPLSAAILSKWLKEYVII